MNDAAPRAIAPQEAEHDAAESSVRPATLDEFIGQHQLRNNLRVFIEAATSRGEALDHILFFGPPGLGKTTLAQIVAREMGVDFHATSGPVIQRAADLVALLSRLGPREVLFIDEIHRMPPAAEEYLYPAMEDYQIDLIIGQGPGARSIRYRIAPFTLIGATTRSGLITRPLRERFGIPLRLVFYEPAELQSIVTRGADGMDRRYLRCIAENYAGGPVGVETIAAALGDERDVIEEVIEPYLIQEGFVQRTPRGRVLTRIAFRHLDLPMPASLPAQLDLLAPLPFETEVEEAP